MACATISRPGHHRRCDHCVATTPSCLSSLCVYVYKIESSKMSKHPAAILDHIVILVPHPTLLNLPQWLTSAFTVLTGGRHADGVTENKLVVLSDGVYLELIAFVPGREADRASHRWGARKEGRIIDWAITLRTEDDLAAVRGRLDAAGTGILYDEPVPGGRITPDGTELRWATSAPCGPGLAGGEAPFWCLDRTPRELRVPRGAAVHPSGALGVAGVAVSVGDGDVFRALKGTFDVLQGEEGAAGADGAWGWPLRVPEAARGGARGLSLRPVAGEDVFVKLSLLSESTTGTVGGSLGDDACPLEIEFFKP